MAIYMTRRLRQEIFDKELADQGMVITPDGKAYRLCLAPGNIAFRLVLNDFDEATNTILGPALCHWDYHRPEEAVRNFLRVRSAPWNKWRADSRVMYDPLTTKQITKEVDFSAVHTIHQHR